MHPKFILGLLSALAATSFASPTPADNAVAEVADLVQREANAEFDKRAIIRWNASGGCRTDWSGRCNAACRSEAYNKGCKAGTVGSAIDGGDCTNPFKSHCKCHCEV
ncbi:uncharacterized protein EI97DRAFT_460482 [Westerdykella ornata]|uniref:Invertebrate defensins family profile domain-containing protein n=1 Tax=Westerdykella ornata TaxID=318751 RepID=A0A6A6JCT9_WESOR|nr:uncharacterized protein EI97DRAFT_460482 [Westerdykella ornata]KAF2274087.1 hypothetical protein EI97DRAFT_460482 [Westerdykella ornata]